MKPSATVISLVIVNWCLSERYTEAILRNDITDRCIHLDSTQHLSTTERTEKAAKSLSVYARTCSWDSSPKDKKTTKSDPNEWLEIVPTQTQQPFFILRKIEKNIEACLSSVDNQPMASNSCSIAAAEFKIDKVQQTNFKGLITSTTSFKIRNDNGQCLTVKPGTITLKFKECSAKAGLFQVWSVCRHTRQCDVDFTWTAREIKFPSNGTNITIPTTSIINTSISTPMSGLDTQRKMLYYNYPS